MQMEALWAAQPANRQSPAWPAAINPAPVPGAMPPASQPGALPPSVPQPGAVQPSAPQPGLVPPPAPLLGVAQPAAPRPAPHAHSPVWQANLARLAGLGEVLAQHGLRTRLITPPGRVPSLHVVNPQASALAEDVYAGRAQDGLWWFWWSWAERITVGEDLEGAASRIKRVLAAS